MKFIHPIFMLILLGFLYKIYKTGTEALKINEKSPEFEKKKELLHDHSRTAKIVTALMIPGFIGGIIGVVYFLGVPEVFLKTYGHGFLGAAILGLMLSNIFVGKSVKRPKRPKQRENLLSFHRGLMYFILLASVGAILTGVVVLMKGVSS